MERHIGIVPVADFPAVPPCRPPQCPQHQAVLQTMVSCQVIFKEVYALPDTLRTQISTGVRALLFTYHKAAISVAQESRRPRVSAPK
jgi:hypothetical protein